MTVSSGVTDRHLPTIQPLTARSVVLSTLLGYYPPELPVSALIRVGALFGIAERSIRTAVSRMVSTGDLRASDGVYGLTQRLIDRQAWQDASCFPETTQWDATWEIAIVTSPPRPLAERVALRKSMAQLRLAELREGVWTRPANLVRDLHDVVIEQCTFFQGQNEDSPALAQSLWQLRAWATEARRLEAAIDAVADLRDGFIVTTEVIRHLLVDACLPPSLLPDDWPGDRLRERYAEFNVTYAAKLREYSEAA
ncbi:MAG: transcriptional regulator, PaaX family [Pseudonocardiales bacterium]|nr:transcriptional regulator, PaaX family [Pseudonocardiales bacterium]